jgi:hypothetical protein
MAHSCARFSIAAFASLRLCENRRLNKEAHLSPRRKGAAIYSSKTINPRLNSKSADAADESTQRGHCATFSRHRLVTQQDISIAEGPRLYQFQAQLISDAIEHRSPFAENDGIHHDLVFIDQPFLRQL